jgi:hypothetical protein
MPSPAPFLVSVYIPPAFGHRLRCCEN